MSIVDNVSVRSMTNVQDAPSLVVPPPPPERYMSAFIVLEHSNMTLRVEYVDGTLVWRERSVEYVDGTLVWRERKDTSLYHGFRTCPSVEKSLAIVPARPSKQLAPRRWYISAGDQLAACFTNPRSGKKHADFLGFVARVHVV